MGSMKYLGVFFAVILAASVLFIQPAGAAIVDDSNSSLNGGLLQDYSGSGKWDFAFTFADNQPVTLKSNFDQTDVGLNNQIFLAASFFTSTDAWGGFKLTLSDGATFAQVNSITPALGNVSAVSSSANTASITFNPAESLGFYIGAPGEASGSSDWVIALNGNSGSINLTAAPVPLPPSVLMFLSGLGVTGFFVRRRFTWM